MQRQLSRAFPSVLSAAVLVFATYCLAQSPVAADTTSKPVTSSNSADASAVIRAAIAALGGERAIASLRNVHATGTIALPEEDSKRSLAFTWDDDISGPKLEFRDEVRDGPNVRVFVSGHGSPAQLVNGKRQSLFAYVADAAPPLHLPAVVLFRRRNGGALKNTIVAQEVSDGKAVVHVRLAIETGSPADVLQVQDWYIEQGTGLPLRVDYRVPSTVDALTFEDAQAAFSDFRNVDGVYFPFHIEVSQNGKHTSSVIIDSISTNETISPALFETSGGAQ
ncbi:MAG TPA: hypothetical protein VNX88_02525 [Terriglobales bacterium]|nr:hypothetical protein [Terriglobales bacterium]